MHFALLVSVLRVKMEEHTQTVCFTYTWSQFAYWVYFIWESSFMTHNILSSLLQGRWCLPCCYWNSPCRCYLRRLPVNADGPECSNHSVCNCGVCVCGSAGDVQYGTKTQMQSLVINYGKWKCKYLIQGFILSVFECISCENRRRANDAFVCHCGPAVVPSQWIRAVNLMHKKHCKKKTHTHIPQAQ